MLSYTPASVGVFLCKSYSCPKPIVKWLSFKISFLLKQDKKAPTVIISAEIDEEQIDIQAEELAQKKRLEEVVGKLMNF